jgi:hypothetical protein
MSADMVTIESFEYVQQAEGARDLLEHRGIRAVIVNADIVAMDWVLGNAVGYVQVQVSRADAEAAAEILRQNQERRKQQRSLGGDTGEMACLACGANIPASRRDCPSCGWSYSAAENTPSGEDITLEDETDPDDQSSALEAFRKSKRTVFLLLLTPTIVGLVLLGLGAIALVVWFLQSLVNR